MNLDTSATTHMSDLLNLFTTLTKVKDCYATLDDGTTKLPIIGKDTIRIYIESQVVGLHNVVFVPELEDTLFSITEHIKSLNCSFKAEKNKYTLYYSKFSINAKLDNADHVNIKPCSDINITLDFSTKESKLKTQPQKNTTNITQDNLCRTRITCNPTYDH